MTKAQAKELNGPVSMLIDLEPRSKPIEGSVTFCGTAIPFVGWLGLAAAIESAIAAGGSQDAGVSTARASARSSREEIESFP